MKHPSIHNFKREISLATILLAVFLVGVLVLAVGRALPLASNAVSSVTVDNTETVSQPLNGVERAAVNIRFGAGNLNTGALAPDSDLLIEGTGDLSGRETLGTELRATGGVGTYTLESNGSFSTGPDFLLEQDIVLKYTVFVPLPAPRVNFDAVE